MTSNLFAFGLGIGTKNAKGEWLEVFYPEPLLNPSVSDLAPLVKALGYGGGNKIFEVDATSFSAREDLPPFARQFKNSPTKALIAVFLAEDSPLTSAPEAYLKLHLLSHRLVKPHAQNLSGLFAVLPNVAWTNKGAVDPTELSQLQLICRTNGETLSVESIDKFPKMTDYVVPNGVRIADASRVRLGAYVGEGTTVMHEGFINFNAGTEGPNMVEGRISAGVFVGSGSDLGGGCSTMGTLSGGGNVVISIGRNSLIGANAGVGIALGDKCTVEAGLYVTAGSKLKLYGPNKQLLGTVKARELSGKSNLLFRRNSLDGSLECIANENVVALNEELHKN